MFLQQIFFFAVTMKNMGTNTNLLENGYPGSGGCPKKDGIKIQLEYDLHSGQFLNFQVGPGKNNDKTFGTECLDGSGTIFLR